MLQQLTFIGLSDVGALFVIPHGDHFVVLDRSQPRRSCLFLPMTVKQKSEDWPPTCGMCSIPWMCAANRLNLSTAWMSGVCLRFPTTLGP